MSAARAPSNWFGSITLASPINTNVLLLLRITFDLIKLITYRSKLCFSLGFGYLFLVLVLAYTMAEEHQKEHGSVENASTGCGMFDFLKKKENDKSQQAHEDVVKNDHHQSHGADSSSVSYTH